MLASNAPKRAVTKPRKIEPEIAYDPRVEGIFEDISEVRKDLEECKDVKSKMDVLDERTKVLITQATENRAAIFGTANQPGINTRMTTLENKLEEVKQFVGEVKKVGIGVLVAVLGIFIELLIQLILSHGTVLAK